MNKYLLLPLLPILALLFFAYTMHEMKTSETALSSLYAAHTTMLERVVANPSDEKNITAQFAKHIKLSTSAEARIKRSVTLQKILERATFARPHCLNTKETPCKVYTDEVIAAAKLRYGKITLLTGRSPPAENILTATSYSTKDHARTITVLLLITLAITSVPLWLWSRK